MDQRTGRPSIATAKAACRLGVSKPTLWRAMCGGAVAPAYRTPGGYLRFRAAAIDAYARRRAAPESGE